MQAETGGKQALIPCIHTPGKQLHSTPPGHHAYHHIDLLLDSYTGY